MASRDFWFEPTKSLLPIDCVWLLPKEIRASWYHPHPSIDHLTWLYKLKVAKGHFWKRMSIYCMNMLYRKDMRIGMKHLLTLLVYWFASCNIFSFLRVSWSNILDVIVILVLRILDIKAFKTHDTPIPPQGFLWWIFPIMINSWIITFEPWRKL